MPKPGLDRTQFGNARYVKNIAHLFDLLGCCSGKGFAEPFLHESYFGRPERLPKVAKRIINLAGNGAGACDAVNPSPSTEAMVSTPDNPGHELREDRLIGVLLPWQCGLSSLTSAAHWRKASLQPFQQGCAVKQV